MDYIRLKWEPKSKVPLHYLEECLVKYTNEKGGVTLLENGTVLFLKSSDDNEADAVKGLEEAKFLTDFQVQEMQDGNYLVVFHSAVVVFISKEEFLARRVEIAERINELKFPSEEMLHPTSSPTENLLIGMYARGKLQKDAFDFKYYKRL